MMKKVEYKSVKSFDASETYCEQDKNLKIDVLDSGTIMERYHAKNHLT